MQQHLEIETFLGIPANRSLRLIARLTLIFLVGQPFAATAQVIADQSAAATIRPVIDTTANGIPLVQITAPNASGLSRNVYSQFNVDSGGVILNNSNTAVLTQQAGYVTGNQNMANGTARIILNEINSTSASQLNGYTEVAGSRAEVIIANPNGISCNGCGFINTSRGVLTTGTAVFGGSGSLEAFRVSGGEINIGSAGLNAGNTDQLDLIARSVKVNGELWGNNLNVISGTNQINYANLGVQVIAGDANQPTVGIDVALLGGMYAHKIRLLGTEAGVGVNSQGTLATKAGDINIDNQGLVTLAGSTVAGANLSVSGSSINATGNLGAGIDSSGVATQTGALTLNATDPTGGISNSGRIAGNTITSNSDTFSNNGTVIGDTLSLSANSLSNQGAAAIIASTQQTNLVVQNTVNNLDGATILSLGDINIGANLTQDANGYLTGNTATLNNASASIEAGNNLRIGANQITNQRTVVGVEWSAEYGQTHIDGNPRYDQSYADDQYTANTTASAQLLAGNNIWLSGNALTNSYSSIAAANTLNANVTTTNNTGDPFRQRTTITNGKQDIQTWGVIGGYDGWCGVRRCWKEIEGWIYSTVDYTPAPTYLDISPAQYTNSGHTAATVGTVGPLTVPTNGLYSLHPQPGRQYLVVTDPRFTSYQNFLSSDYMLGRLVLDPALMQKRLGDGYYEQKLIADQILQATGKRNLAGYSNTQAGYQALMDAALAESAELQLIPGVALSKEQIAALRRDIVWMVAEDVKLPDGSITKALAPKVYFSQTVQMKLSPGGALIAANEINIKAGGVLDNSGQIISDAATNLIVGDLINRGSISSGGILYVQAEQDISNLSGNLAGNDVTLEAGRDLRNVRSANNTATSTELGLEAGISASNNLNLSAGRNLTVVAANISAGGNASLNAGENLTVSTLATQQNSSGAYNAYINKVTHLGSQLDIGGDITLQSGNDLQLTSAKVNAEGDMTLITGGDLNLSSVKNIRASGYDSGVGRERHYDETDIGATLNAGNNLTLIASNGNSARTDNKGNITLQSAELYSQGKTTLAADANINLLTTDERHESMVERTTKSSDWFTSTTITTRDTTERTDAIGSSLKAGSLVMQAGKDINVSGSRAEADKDITLAAVRDINISAATNTFAEDHYFHKTTSGWQIDDKLNITDQGPTITSKKHLDGGKQSQSRSLIQSNNGNLTAVAGNNLIVSGSDLRALAQAPTRAPESEHEHEQEHHQDDDHEKDKHAKDKHEKDKQSDSSRTGQVNLKAGNTIALISGVDTLNKTSETVIETKPNLWTKQIRTITDTSSRVDSFSSRISGNAIKMESGGDVILQGADLNAGKDGITLDAARDLQLLAAFNSHQSSHKETLRTDGFAMSYGMFDYFDLQKIDKKAENKTQTANLTQLQSSGNISTRSGRDTTLQAGILDAAGSIDLITGNVEQPGKLILQGVKETSYRSEEDKRNSAAWQSQSGKGEYKETLKLTNIKAGKGFTVNAAGGIEVDIATVPAPTPAPAAEAQLDENGELLPLLPPPPALSLEQQAAKQKADFDAHIESLASQPGQAWISQLAKHDNVTFNQTKLALQKWDYKNEGLTQEAAIVIAIAVTYASAGSAGTAANTIVAGAGATGATAAVASAAIAAGLTTLASQATINLINNKGDVGRTLDALGKEENIKALATAMVTAGALQGLNKALGMTDVTAKSGYTDQLNKNLLNNAASARIDVLINGGNLEDKLLQGFRNAFIDTSAAQGANWIGDLKEKGDLNALTHKFAHAIAGCAAGEARNNQCSSGALGAVVGEISAELYGGSRTNGNNIDVAALKTDTVNFAKLMAAMAAVITGKDVNLAAAAGGNAAENNFLGHADSQRRRELRRKFDNGTETPADARELRILDERDQVSDRLLAQWKASPDSLSSSEQVALNDSVNRYVGAYTGQDRQDKINIMMRLKPDGYGSNGFPYAGGEVAINAYMDEHGYGLTNPRPAPGKYEEMYYKAGSLMSNNAYHRENAELGTPALMFAKGPVGLLANFTMMAQGSYQVGQGAGALDNGEYGTAAWDISVGALTMAGAKFGMGLSLGKGGATLSAAEQAVNWQGSGLYPGVDRYRNIVLQPDTYIVGATPGQSNYYTTISGMQRTGMDVIQYYKGAQLAPNLTNSAHDVVRDGLTIYRVTDTTPAAFGRALANPQYGKGKLPQVFVPDFTALEPVGFIPFANKISGIKP